eukprot:4208908-Pyramimonas_sp.AAC.1
MSAATAVAWRRRMQLPAAQGGCGAHPATLEDIQHEPDDLQRPMRDDMDALEMAMTDYEQMSSTVWRLRYWRTWPQWSCPPEIL